MCLSREGARRADRSSPATTLGNREVAQPLPTGFSEAEKNGSQGKAIRGRVTGARRREWVAEGEGGKTEVAEETEAGGSDEARDLSRGGAGGRQRSAPGSSQRKEKARHYRYLCGRSERPRGRRVLQQFHLELLRHRRRRRCGRRLGHVALDHWRKVGSKQPRLLAGSPPPHPAPPCSGLPGARRCARWRSGRRTGPGHLEKRHPRELGGVRGEGLLSCAAGPGRASAEQPRRDCPRQEGGS